MIDRRWIDKRGIDKIENFQNEVKRRIRKEGYRKEDDLSAEDDRRRMDIKKKKIDV
jgi:hypothetical protein